jgi:prepilin-type N-terminal cleavage/methylation domain-containing protein
MRASSTAGFTLIELMISITLVAAVAAGMLSAMRGGLLTLERVQSHIQESRGALGLDQMIRSQVGGVLPATGDCANDGQAVKSPLFRGNAGGMLMVTSYSMSEGARGYPRVVEYSVLPNDDGTLRLVADEVLFPSPATTLNFCAPPSVLRPLGPAARSMVLAPRLAFARISYREVDPATRLGGAWFPEWIKPNLPYAVRIEMEPGGSITVPLHVTRDYREFYADRK